MAVVVEPPRARPGPKELGRYPGLTPEERGVDPPPRLRPSPVPEAPPPLWIMPSGVPKESRSLGFVGPLPEPELPPAAPPEGLFDVPGLLERLWLARALEASHRERWAASAAVEAPEPGAPPARPVAAPVAPHSPVRSGALSWPMLSVPAPPVAPPAEAAVAPPSPPPPAEPPRTAPSVRPRSWICPYCYLTNDANATTCRGCRSGNLHF